MFAAVCVFPILAVQSQDDAPTSAPAKAEDELAEKLIKSGGASGEADVMDRIADLMDRTRVRLSVDFDGGQQTQALQQRIVKDLDEAIATAAANRRQASSSRSESGSDRRTMPKPQEQGQAARDSASTTGEPGTTENAGSDAQDESRSGALRETRRGWGNLPPRDRDEMTQGEDHEFIEKYRALIDRYFRALGESEEE